jgi:hypothetical protein
MTEPLVTYVLSVACDERLQALKGEAAVVVNDEVVFSQKVARADIDGHASWAVVELARQAKEALDAAQSTKTEPPSTQPQREPKRRKGQTVKPTRSSGVSRSRLR